MVTPAEFAGVEAGMEKAAWTKPPIKAEHLVLGAGAAAVTGLVGYDVYKGWGLGGNHKAMDKAFKDRKKAVDSRAFIRKYDPKVTVCTTESEVRRAINREKGIDDFDSAVVIGMLSQMIMSKTNAAALRGESGEYIFCAPRMHPEILGHELGHIWDYRRKGITYKNQGPYRPRALSGLWKPSFKKETYHAETAAWKKSPFKSKDRPGIEEAALGTYEKSFHRNRAKSTATAAGLVAAMIAATIAQESLV